VSQVWPFAITAGSLGAGGGEQRMGGARVLLSAPDFGESRSSAL